MSLPRRTLGNTGLQVSILGFGASPLGNVFQEVEEEAATAAVHEAFNLGINFFDTSPFYGITKSEARLGAALSSLPREELLIATKVGRYGPEEFDFSAERVRRSVQESLTRLQTSYIDLVQCHDIEFADLNQVVEETIPTLQELKKEGKVRFIGITGLPLKIYEYVLDRVPPGSIDVILSYCHLTLCDCALQDIIPYLQNKQVGIINASPLAMGLLTPQGPPSWHPAAPELQAAAKAAAAACAEAGVDIARLGIMHSLKCEDVATTLVGMCSVEQVRANVRHALEAVEATPAQDTAVLERALEQVRSIFQPVMNVTWPSGKPENN